MVFSKIILLKFIDLTNFQKYLTDLFQTVNNRYDGELFE